MKNNLTITLLYTLMICVSLGDVISQSIVKFNIIEGSETYYMRSSSTTSVTTGKTVNYLALGKLRSDVKIADLTLNEISYEQYHDGFIWLHSVVITNSLYNIEYKKAEDLIILTIEQGDQNSVVKFKMNH